MDLIGSLKETLKNEMLSCFESYGSVYVESHHSSIIRVLTLLGTESLRFNVLVDMFAICLGLSCKVYYQLKSYSLNQDLFVYTQIDHGTQIMSATLVFENANWLEREIFEKQGINFKNHPDLRNLFN